MYCCDFQHNLVGSSRDYLGPSCILFSTAIYLNMQRVPQRAWCRLCILRQDYRKVTALVYFQGIGEEN